MSSLKEWAWHKTGRAVLWALLEAARNGELEADWRVMWADRTAAALRVARAGDPDWWRGDAARHIRAVSPGQGWPWVGPVIRRPAPIPVETPRLGPGLPGFDVIAVRRTAAAAAGYRRAGGAEPGGRRKGAVGTA